ncbi:MAG: hemerythrin domain-containing protein [Candidatus Omnitrophica bacterium]|nr:hemerythrin domain-containing protein [Candidatus Omnitrophota bacterium]
MQERKEEQKKDSAFDKVREEHKEVSEQMWMLKKSLQYLNDEEAYSNIRKVIDFFKDSVLKHFEWEEHEVFPIALAIGDLEIKQVVRELQQQHIFIISRFDIIADIIMKYGFSLNNEMKNKFIETSKEMLGAVLQHAQKEDKELFPFLEDKNVDLNFDN